MAPLAALKALYHPKASVSKSQWFPKSNVSTREFSPNL